MSVHEGCGAKDYGAASGLPTPTLQFQEALWCAGELARMSQAECIDAAHIVRALLAGGGGSVAAQLIQRAGVDTGSFRRQMQCGASSSSGESVAKLPFCRSAVKLLEHAAKRHNGLGHTRVGTVHLLLGALYENDDLLRVTLSQAAMDHASFLRAVERALADESADED